MLPAEEMRSQGWTAPLDNSGRLLLCRAAAALVCVAHVATWSAFQQHGFVADGIHEVLCRLAHCVTTLHMNPKEGFFAEVWNERAVSLWPGSPSIWIELLSMAQAPMFEIQRRAVGVVLPRVFAKAPELASPCSLPHVHCWAPSNYVSRQVAIYARPHMEWSASLRRQVASAFTEDDVKAFTTPALPFLGMEHILQESGKLRETDELLRRLLVATRSHPTTTVLLFCHCPHAAQLLQRLLTYRRYAHAFIEEALHPTQRARKLQVVRSKRFHVLLFQGASFGPTVGVRSAFAAVFFDQDPAQSGTLSSVQQVLPGETLRVFYLVSAVGASQPGWEETAVSLLSEAAVSWSHASAQLLQAERNSAALMDSLIPRA